MDSSCEYVQQAVGDGRKEVVLQLQGCGRRNVKPHH